MIQTPFKALGYLKKKQVLPFKKEREKVTFVQADSDTICGLC